MQADHATRPVTALKIHCPIDSATMSLMAAGDFTAIDPQCALGRILAIVRGHRVLGDFGVYRSVIEIGTGWELFTPSSGAKPALGVRDAPTASPTAILTLYIPGDADEDAASAALSAMVAAHPWEVPVIEITRTALVTRA